MDFLSILIESDAKISMFMKEEKMEKSNKGCTFYSNDMKCITVTLPYYFKDIFLYQICSSSSSIKVLYVYGLVLWV